MGIFSSKDKKEKEEKVLQSPVSDMVDEEPVFTIDGTGGNLFVYNKFVVLDHTKGGIINLGNRTYKIVPVKNIMAIQVKTNSGLGGFVEVSTPGHEYTEQKGFDRLRDENTINFATDEALETANAIAKFLLPKII